MTNLSKPSTANLSKKGYVFGFVQPTSPEFAKYPPLVGPTVDAYGGKMLCKQPVEEAVYTENVGNFAASFVLEFPSLKNALDWYNSEEYKDPKKLRLSTSKGPLVIVEGDDFEDYVGFLTAFIKVNDHDMFSKYDPVESLANYKAKRIYVPMDEAALTETDEHDVAVLIAFPSSESGKEWMESVEYKANRDLRLKTTEGPCAIIGN